MNFVLDSSLGLAFVLADEATTATDKVLDSLGKGAKAFVPALWRWEIGNALLMAQRRKRLVPAEVHRHLALLAALPIEPDEGAFEEAWTATLLLAQKHKLTCYDAAYLELALRSGIALATLDADLRSAAKSEKVALLP